MPTLGNALDFQKYEARNLRHHQLASAPGSPVTGQQYYNTGDNTLYWWNGTAWLSAGGGLTQATADTLYVNVAGDTMTGNLTFAGAAANVGTIRLANLSEIDWRNQANSANLALTVDGTDALYWSGNVMKFAGDTTIQRTGSGLWRMNSQLGVGVSPALWGASITAVQFGFAGAVRSSASAFGSTGLINNSYYDGTNNRAIVTGAASVYDLGGGNFYWYSAPSVAAGAVQTFTTRMALDANGNMALGGNLPVWGANQRAFHVGANGVIWGNAAAEGFGEGSNTYYDGSVFRAISAGPGITGTWSNGSYVIANAPSVAAGAAQTYSNRVMIAANGNLQINPDGGVAHLTSAAGVNFQITAGAGASPAFVNSSGYVLGIPDNTTAMGHPSFRFTTIYISGAPVVGSHVDLKENVAPLDPTACAQAVLDTDWVSYDYKAPPMSDAPVTGDDEPEEKLKKAKLHKDAYDTMLEETAFSRKQKGYVLGSPDWRVSDLFGLPDRENRSDGADIGVLGAALQDALKRIAALEARNA